MQDDIEHFGDVGSLDDNVESFLSQDDGDGRDLFGTLKRNPSEHATDASKGNLMFSPLNKFLLFTLTGLMVVLLPFQTFPSVKLVLYAKATAKLFAVISLQMENY